MENNLSNIHPYTEEMRNFQERALEYLNVIDVIVVLLNRRAEIAFINKKAQDLFGAADRLVGRNWFECCVPPAEKEELSDVFEHLMRYEEQKYKSYENLIRASDGTERCLAWHNTLIKDGSGKVIGTLSLGEDVTERRRADQALLASERRFRTLIETTESIVIYLNTEGVILEFNPAAEKLYGRERKDAIGQNFLDLFLRGNERDGMLSVTAKASEGMPGHGFETSVITRDGSTRIISWDVVRTLDVNNNPSGVISTGQDITERKKAESDHARYLHHLETVNRIGAVANSSLELKDVLTRILEGILSATGASVGMIFRRDLTTRTLSWGGSVGLSQRFVNEYARRVIQPGEGLTGRIAESGEPIYIREDSSHDPRIARMAVAKEGLNTFFGLPVKVDNDVVAVMNILTRPPAVMKQEDEIKLITSVAAYVGSAIRNATLYTELQQAGQALRSAYDDLERKVEERTKQLAESESLFRQTAENIREVIWLFSPDESRMLYVSQAYEQIWGRKLPDLYADLEQWFDAIHGDDAERIRAAHRRRLVSGEFDQEYRILRPNGSMRWIHERSFPICDKEGRIYRFAGIAEDISVRKAAEEQIRISQQATMNKLYSALEQVGEAVSITGRNGIIEYVNPGFVSITGYRAEEAIGKDSNILRSGKHESRFYAHVWNTILNGNSYQGIFINRRKNGEIYYEEKSISPLKNAAGDITHFIATGRDITGRIQAEERLQQLAYHDPLTNLPNRALFVDRMGHALSKRVNGRQIVALIFLDIDHFKNINDTLGHETGDNLLKALPARVISVLRESDTVSRFGGDEFAILLEDVPSVEAVSGVTEKLLQAFVPPFVIAGRELYVTVSLGVAFYPKDGRDSETLFRHADAAMYRAKDLGRNRYQFYSEDIGSKISERVSTENLLRRAQYNNEFLLYYQPVIGLDGQQVCGAEALIRWRHPQLGIVEPDRFISLLEDTGLIVSVGEWVLATSCHQAAQWQQRYRSDFRIAVNLSGRQFRLPNLRKMLTGILENAAMQPWSLELEITESVLMQDDAISRDNLAAINELGVRLSVDDFGTGYSSLGYLRRFPLSTLKIAYPFIRGIPHEPDEVAIVTAIVAMAKQLHLRVIAEGVETPAQFDFLKEAGCDGLQGFLFAQPMPAEDMEELLKRHGGHASTC